jgi:hypothetical protein
MLIQLDLEHVAVEEENGADGLVPPAPTAGAVCVEAETDFWLTRWVTKSLISGTPISFGCLLW